MPGRTEYDRRRAHQRRRDNQAAYARRAAREQARHIVPLSERRHDDGIIDHTAIDLALRHWRRHGAALSREELREAIRLGLQRELGTPELAELLCLWEREVERFRAELRAEQREPVAVG